MGVVGTAVPATAVTDDEEFEITSQTSGPVALTQPTDVVRDDAGNFYVSDSGNDRVVRIAGEDGAMVVVAGGGTNTGLATDPATDMALSNPTGLAIHNGVLFIADTGNHRIIRMTTQGVPKASVVAGAVDGTPGSTNSATNLLARFNDPRGLAVNEAGDLFVADRGNHRIREVSVDGGVTTFVGSNQGFNGEVSPPAQALLSSPNDVIVDTEGGVIISDRGNRRVRRVNATQSRIETIAGNGGVGPSGDGAIATDAELPRPRGLALDADGNLYIADPIADSVRRVDAETGIITTVVGAGTEDFTGDGGPARDAELHNPRGLTFDGLTMVLVDSDNNRVRYIADTTDPRVELSVPATVPRFGAATPATFTCVDQGLVTCAAVAAGDAYASGDALPADRLGSKVVTLTATDAAGNQAQATGVYTVDWTVYGTYAGATGVEGIVVRYYIATFGRLPDTEGFNFWVGRLNTEPGDPSVPAFFTESPEFNTLYGAVSDAVFVETIYRNVLGRDPDVTGRDFWAGELSAGRRTRGQVMEFFAQSPEHMVLTATG